MVKSLIHHNYNNIRTDMLQNVSELLVSQFVAAIDGDKNKANTDKAVLNAVQSAANGIMMDILGERKVKTKA
jgi:hypothetical protein